MRDSSSRHGVGDARARDIRLDAFVVAVRAIARGDATRDARERRVGRRRWGHHVILGDTVIVAAFADLGRTRSGLAATRRRRRRRDRRARAGGEFRARHRKSVERGSRVRARAQTRRRVSRARVLEVLRTGARVRVSRADELRRGSDDGGEERDARGARVGSARALGAREATRGERAGQRVRTDGVERGGKRVGDRECGAEGFDLAVFGDAEAQAGWLLENVLAKPGSGKKGRLVSAKTRTGSDGTTYYTFEYTIQTDTWFRHNVAVFATRGTTLYTFVAQIPETRWLEMRETFFDMADSFRVFVPTG